MHAEVHRVGVVSLRGSHRGHARPPALHGGGPLHGGLGRQGDQLKDAGFQDVVVLTVFKRVDVNIKILQKLFNIFKWFV